MSRSRFHSPGPAWQKILRTSLPFVALIWTLSVATGALPPLTELAAAPGQAPQSVELRWLTPLFEPGGFDGREVTCQYEFRYGSGYLTAGNFSFNPLLEGSLPDVIWDGALDVALDLNVMAGNNNTFPIYTVYWDQAYLRAWLYVSRDSPFIYGSAGAGLPNETITFTITKDNDPNWRLTRSVQTDRYGYAEWQTDDICNAANGEWFTFTARWNQHAVNLRNGMVVQASQGAEDSEHMMLYDDTDVINPPHNMSSGGAELAWSLEDYWILAWFAAHATEEDCEVAASVPLVVPPPEGMLPGVPGAMLAFTIEKNTGPELARPIEIRVTYPPSRLLAYGGTAECAMEAYRYEEGDGRWLHLPERVGVNRADHSITFVTNRLGLFAIGGEHDFDLDGGGDLQELDWGTSPGMADSDGDGCSDGDELWWSGGHPLDPPKVHGSDQHAVGQGLSTLPHYWIAGRIVSDRETSPISACAYLGPPIDVSYTQEWSGPALFKSHAAWQDFDGDGDPDLSVCGLNLDTPVTLTYENTGADLMHRQSLTGVWNEGSGGLAWGDYDLDGDMDLAVAGAGAAQPFAGIYQNDGGGHLALDASQALVGISYASLAWADFDEDLDPDLLLMGHDGVQARTVLYRNQPPGTLTPDTVNVLTGLFAGSADWGDYDNDGDLDLLTTGSDGTQRRTILYRNHPTGWLTSDSDHGLPGVAFSDAAWGDIDRDGDPDLAFTGEASGQLRFARIYRNDQGELTLIADLLDLYRSSCALGDVDLDGDMDVCFCGYDGSGLWTYLWENLGDGFAPLAIHLPGVREGSLDLLDVDMNGSLDLFLTGSDWSTGYALLYRHGGIPSSAPPSPSTARLHLEIPSPSQGPLAFRYGLARAGWARLAIYDLTGRCVRTLIDGPERAGSKEIAWDGLAGEGRQAAAGVYFVRLCAEEGEARAKLVRLR